MEQKNFEETCHFCGQTNCNCQEDMKEEYDERLIKEAKIKWFVKTIERDGKKYLVLTQRTMKTVFEKTNVRPYAELVFFIREYRMLGFEKVFAILPDDKKFIQTPKELLDLAIVCKFIPPVGWVRSMSQDFSDIFIVCEGRKTGT